MAEARQRAEWDRTALLAAILVNANRGKNSKAVTPAELNPFRPKPKPVKLNAAESMAALKSVFIDRQLPEKGIK